LTTVLIQQTFQSGGKSCLKASFGPVLTP